MQMHVCVCVVAICRRCSSRQQTAWRCQSIKCCQTPPPRLRREAAAGSSSSSRHSGAELSASGWNAQRAACGEADGGAGTGALQCKTNKAWAAKRVKHVAFCRMSGGVKLLLTVCQASRSEISSSSDSGLAAALSAVEATPAAAAAAPADSEGAPEVAAAMPLTGSAAESPGNCCTAGTAFSLQYRQPTVHIAQHTGQDN